MLSNTLRAALLAPFAFGAIAAPAAAEPFTLFIFEAPADLALRTEESAAGAAYWQAYADFGAAATAAGVLRGGSALYAEPADTATLTAAGAADGGYAPSDLALGGYFQIDVPDRAAALDWAAKLPAATTGAIEVRAGYPVPAM